MTENESRAALADRTIKVVARATGLYRGTITLLYDETASKVDLETIDKLCAFLGVTVGELFEHKPDGNEARMGSGG